MAVDNALKLVPRADRHTSDGRAGGFFRATWSKSMKVVISGGSGQVGTILARALRGDGHDVVVLSRQPQTFFVMAHRRLGWCNFGPVGEGSRWRRRRDQPPWAKRELPIHS